MAQVMYDRAIMFQGNIYTVTQTWNGPEIVVLVEPENEKLRTLITDTIQNQGKITLKHSAGYYEIVAPTS